MEEVSEEEIVLIGCKSYPGLFLVYNCCIVLCLSGAFILLYVLLMALVGLPLFFLELAAGQSIRQGSIGVWRHISPKLVGIGYSSCVVSIILLYWSVALVHNFFFFWQTAQNYYKNAIEVPLQSIILSLNAILCQNDILTFFFL